MTYNLAHCISDNPIKMVAMTWRRMPSPDLQSPLTTNEYSSCLQEHAQHREVRRPLFPRALFLISGYCNFIYLYLVDFGNTGAGSIRISKIGMTGTEAPSIFLPISQLSRATTPAAHVSNAQPLWVEGEAPRKIDRSLLWNF